MMQQLTCAGGHSWQTEAGAHAETVAQICPACGAPGRPNPIAIGGLERSWKWVKRRPAAAALVGVSLAVLLLLVGVWASFTMRLREERDRARKDWGRAEANLDRAMRALDQVLTEVAEEPLAN